MNFLAICDPETKRNESFVLQCRLCEGYLHFSAVPKGATCTEGQTACVPPALNQSCLVLLGFPAVSCPVFTLVLLPVTSQCAYLKPTFLATILPRLYKETVFVLFVFLISFAVSHNESELVLLWPLRSRPVIKCRFDLKS